jgi:hypothetical protein
MTLNSWCCHPGINIFHSLDIPIKLRTNKKAFTDLKEGSEKIGGRIGCVDAMDNWTTLSRTKLAWDKDGQLVPQGERGKNCSCETAVVY